MGPDITEQMERHKSFCAPGLSSKESLCLLGRGETGTEAERAGSRQQALGWAEEVAAGIQICLQRNRSGRIY